MAGRGRSDADDALAAALAAGRTVRDAAAAAGVAERTAYRRLGDAAFRGRVSGLRGQMVGAAVGRLAAGMAAAAEALVGLAADPDLDVRHRAAVKVIELGLKAREQAELEDRLAALETQLAADPPGDP